MSRFDHERFDGSLIILPCPRIPAASFSRAHPGRVIAVPSQLRVVRDGVSVFLSPLDWRLFFALFTRPNESLTREDLCEACWGDDDDGGPECIRQCLTKCVWSLRRRLAPLGLTIGMPRYTLLCAAQLPTTRLRAAA